MRRTILALVLGALLLATLAAAAQAQAPGTYGVVDTKRVQDEYKGMQQMQDQFNEYAQAQQSKLMDHEKVMMLADADYTLYFDKLQAAPTEANKKQIADLEALATGREQKLRELMGNKSRTPEQEKEYTELNGVYTARLGELQKLKDDLDKAVQAKGEELMKVANDSMEAAVKAVAEQKKLSVVFPKVAVLYGGVDITNDVLTRLNAPAPAPAK